jgi:glycosyltransferase involved in cell wall biosynthesis
MPNPSSHRPLATPLVSIVTPAYNQAHFLEQTIDSVLAQDYPRLEYIVLDDGSTDATSEVLAKYRGRVIWQHHENMGQSRTLNKGWRMAKGDIVGYLSSDDRLLPGTISAGVAALLATPKAIVSYCDFELIDARSRTIRTIRAENYARRRLRQQLVCQPGPGALFWHWLLDRVGGWPENLEQVADLAFWLRASDFGDFVRVPEVLAQFRVHGGSASFRQIPSRRAGELIGVVRELSSSWPEDEARMSLAMAHLFAARSHLRGRRLRPGVEAMLTGARLHPRILCEPLFWRHIGSGLVGRLWYTLRAQT